MTITATWSGLSEAEALRLADRLIDSRLPVEPVSVDANEKAQGDWRVVAYFEDPPEAASLAGLGAAEPEIAPLPDEDWVARSLAGLPPVRAGRYLVHGSHDRHRRKSSDIAIEIEAGQAFGTGHHGTTAGVLRAIEAAGRRRRFRNALDLGTGSGVLAIGIARAFRIPVLATDIDPVAAVVAEENVRLNGVAGLVTVAAAPGFRHPVFADRARFDLLVANILAGPLIRMAPAIAARLAAGGTLILSGILPSQANAVIAAYVGQRLALARRSELDGWSTLVFGR